MPTIREATRKSRRRWDRKARLYDLLTAPMERIMGLARGSAWVFERVCRGRVLSLNPFQSIWTRMNQESLGRARAREPTACLCT